MSALACLALASGVSSTACAAPASAARVTSSGIPAAAIPLLPKLRAVQMSLWPDAPQPHFLAGQIEQESCPSLRSAQCWNVRAQLKTSRELGFGIGQITIAYNADGSVRFNKWAELRAQFEPLRAWSWEQRFDADYQLTALVLMDRGLCRVFGDAASQEDLLAFCLAAYNGGLGGVRQDRLLCSHTGGCMPARWFGNVELHSMKARIPFRGYGRSPFQINREYPQAILHVRRQKYEEFFFGEQ